MYPVTVLAALQVLVKGTMQCVPDGLQEDNLPLLKALMAYVALGGFLEADPDMKPLQKVGIRCSCKSRCLWCSVAANARMLGAVCKHGLAAEHAQ